MTPVPDIIGSPSLLQIVAGILGAFVLAVVSHRLRLLTAGGAFVQWCMGVVIFGIGGWAAALPIVAFFTAASVISKLADPMRRATMEGKGSTRDAVQVLANGGIAAGLVLLGMFVHDSRVYHAYIGAIAAASADTIATEIGTVFGTRPRLITSGREVQSGTSGAVTFAGMLGAIGGSGLVVLAAIFWLGGLGFSVLIGLVIAGFGGSLVDSVLGALVQARFLCRVCGKSTENAYHCDEPSIHVAGIRPMTNDAVNIICTAAGAMISVMV